MIRTIKLSNFKCFQELVLPCTRLNLLCGLNGMGKSSVIQALLVLRQSFDSGALHGGRLVLGEALTDLGIGSDVLCDDAEQEAIGFEIHDDRNQSPCALWFHYSTTADALHLDPTTTRPPDQALPLSSAWCESHPFGGDLIYINAERLGPRKLYQHSEQVAHDRSLGTRGEFTLNFLSKYRHQRLDEDDPRCEGALGRRLHDVVDRWLQVVSPGARVEYETIQAADAIVAGFAFARQGDVATRRYRATNVGFGLSYVLPVILALLAEPDTLCLIENPEAHLHPRGQAELARLAVLASMAGVQVFVETHSDHFMDGVRIAVREGLIQPDGVAFHYFERTGNRTTVTSPVIDADGRLSHWPQGFFDQHEENLARLLAPKA